ncbi:GAF domain-containing protein [Marinovum sp.]|uniref:GAF domain-containing protein n=1 Tax=Marinovum sp. TaxID=2024839 RepID=UPI002B278EDE|nr:GAF domain-containing protein [Marinovum sp.]
MMEAMIDTEARTFIEVTEYWVPEEGVLKLAGGNYGDLTEFRAASGQTSFAKGEGLPGTAWAEERPVVFKTLDPATFKRAEAAKAAGLTSAVAVPLFDGAELKAVLVVLCGDGEERIGALEVWQAQDTLLMLNDGYYGAAKHFEFVSKHTHFPRGQGLPGAVWAANTPILMRDLGSAYGFVRSESAGQAGLTTGLGLPIPVPSGETFVLTLLSARGTPIARRFEIWDARAAKVGKDSAAVLIDGICAREGRLWAGEGEEPRRATAWQGLIGRVLGTGLPVVDQGVAGIAAGYDNVVALPLHSKGELSHIVAWYS